MLLKRMKFCADAELVTWYMKIFLLVVFCPGRAPRGVLDAKPLRERQSRERPASASATFPWTSV